VMTLTFGFPSFGERGVLLPRSMLGIRVDFGTLGDFDGDLAAGLGLDGGDFLLTGSTRDFGVGFGTSGDFDEDFDGDDIDGFGVDGGDVLCAGSTPGLGFCVLVLGDRSDLNGDGIDIDLGFGERDGVFGTRRDGVGDGVGDGDVGCVDGVDGTSVPATGFRRGFGD